MNPKLSRRAFALVSAGSLMIGGPTLPANAQTPESTPELDRHSTLLDRLDTLDPRTTFDILVASRLEPDSVIALTTDARLVLLAEEIDYDQPCMEGVIGFVELLQDPEGEPFLGGFLVYSDAPAAVAARECIVRETAGIGMMSERIRLAGLESTMVLGTDQLTGVLMLAGYVLILVSNEDLDEAPTSFEAQLTVLQLALDLVKHLDFVLRPSNLP